MNDALEIAVANWNCPCCTYYNTKHSYICDMCFNFQEKWNIADLNPEFRTENKLEKIKHKFGKTNKILLPVLACSTYEQFCQNIKNLYKYYNIKNGLSGIFLINMNCETSVIGDVSQFIKENYPDLWFGVNLLTTNPYTISNFLIKYNPDGLWADKSYITELDYQNVPLHMLNIFKKINWNGLYFGGVLFKYQPENDDKLAIINNSKPYMDVLTTSGSSTGKIIDDDKLNMFLSNLDETNVLATASGNTIETIKSQIDKVNIFIFRSDFVDENDNYDMRKIAELVSSI